MAVMNDDGFFKIVGVIDDWQPVPRFYHADGTSRALADTEQIFVPMTRAVDQEWNPWGNTNCWKAPDEGLSPIEGFLQGECVWTQFWAELETPRQAADYKDFLDNYVREQKKIGRFERPLNTFISDVMEWMDVNRIVRNDNRVLVRLSFLFLLVCVLNTVGLLLAKFLGKSGEVALRRAMGARGREFSRDFTADAMAGLIPLDDLSDPNGQRGLNSNMDCPGKIPQGSITASPKYHRFSSLGDSQHGFVQHGHEMSRLIIEPRP